jgi:hypothetical protein
MLQQRTQIFSQPVQVERQVSFERRAGKGDDTREFSAKFIRLHEQMKYRKGAGFSSEQGRNAERLLGQRLSQNRPSRCSALRRAQVKFRNSTRQRRFFRVIWFISCLKREPLNGL